MFHLASRMARSACCCCLVAKLCPTLYNSIDCSLPGSSVHGDSPGKNTGVGCHALLQGIFPTQGSNPGLLDCRQILYHLSHQGSSKNTGVGGHSFLQRIFPTQGSNVGLPHCRQILYCLSHQGSILQGRFLTTGLPGKSLNIFFTYLYSEYSLF